MSIATSIFGATLTTIAAIKSYLGGDDHLNEEPIHDDAHDLDADDFNRIVAGLAEVTLRARTGRTALVPFGDPALSASLTGQAIFRNGTAVAGATSFPAPCDGSVIGICVHVGDARTAGTLTVNFTVAGAAGALSLTIDDDPDQDAYVMQLPGIDTFDAGQLIGVTYTTSAAWATGSTANASINVDLILALEAEG